MSVSVLLRLVSETAAEGRLAGHAEVVDTGETTAFKDQDEMVAFLRRVGVEPLDSGATTKGSPAPIAPELDPAGPPEKRGASLSSARGASVRVAW